jgi:hypothetical protein
MKKLFSFFIFVSIGFSLGADDLDYDEPLFMFSVGWQPYVNWWFEPYFRVSDDVSYSLSPGMFTTLEASLKFKWGLGLMVDLETDDNFIGQLTSKNSKINTVFQKIIGQANYKKLALRVGAGAITGIFQYAGQPVSGQPAVSEIDSKYFEVDLFYNYDFLDIPKVMALGLSYFTFEMPFVVEGDNAKQGGTFCVYDPSAKFSGYGIYTGFDSFWYGMASYDKFWVDDFHIGPWVSVLGSVFLGSIELHDDVIKRYNDNRHPTINQELSSVGETMLGYNYDFVLGAWGAYYFGDHATLAFGAGYTLSVRGMLRYGVSTLLHHGFIIKAGFSY